MSNKIKTTGAVAQESRVAVPQAVQAAVPLPLLVRDIARDLGITVPQACIALKPLGNYSTNSAVTAEMARMLRDHFSAPAHPAEGVQAAVPDGWMLVPMNGTEEMARAFRAESTPELFYMTTIQCADFQERYRAMLNAAPVAPAHPAEGVPAPMERSKARIAELESVLAHVQEEFKKFGDSFPDGFDWRLFRFVDDTIAATHPTQQGLDAQTQAARSVLAERARQIAAEGYTPEQDDGYNPGVLALHGGLYACHAYDNLTKKRAPEGWQWDAKWWKSKDPRSNLVKAGALILAEIEPLDRSFAAQAKQGDPRQ